MNKNISNSLGKEVLEKIEQKNIKQKNKWYFKLKNILAWISTIFMVLFASHFISGIYLIIKNHFVIPGYLFFILFVVLIIIVVATIYLAFSQFRKIKYSYRRSMRYVFIVGIIFLSLISFMFSYFNIYGSFDGILAKSFPIFSIQNNVHDIWSYGEGGMLAGEVIGIDDDGLVFIKAFNGVIYLVDPILLDEMEIDTFVKKLNVRMLGFQREDIFYPLRIYPWSFHGFNNLDGIRYSKHIIDENIDFSK